MHDGHAQEEVLCFCEWITRAELIAAIPYATNLKDLRETTRACTTCFGCEADLEELVAEYGHLFGTARRGREVGR